MTSPLLKRPSPTSAPSSMLSLASRRSSRDTRLMRINAMDATTPGQLYLNGGVRPSTARSYT
jgi:hypothetical protein